VLAFATGIAAAIGILILMLFTCCFCCLGMIPFLGAYITSFLLLPLNVFFRYFSYEYACQFDLAGNGADKTYEYGFNYGSSDS
jgi:ABC-type enterochelin transport system permease subunit